MKNENYISIQGWMINELELKGNELILYAIIYGFSQDEQSEYFGSQRYISKALGVSLPTANKLINKLLLKKLIHKTGESHYKVLKKVKRGVKESLTGVKESLTPSVKESLTNKYNTNNINTNIINTSELSSQVKEIFNIFYKINPSINWGNKTSRSSAEFLIKKFGFDNTKKMAEQIVSVQGQPYCPTATTPYQMKEKLANFKIYFDNQKNNNKSVTFIS